MSISVNVTRAASVKTPKTAAIWPLFGVHSWDTKHGGAWRLSVLFSALDHNENCNHAAGICSGGSGKVERKALEAAAIALKVKRSTFYLWLADAKKCGIFSGDGKYLYMASQEKMAEIFLCNTIDLHKVIIPLKLLFKAGWKDIVWAAYTKANHNKKLISEKKLQDITGVPMRTQQRLNTHVKRKHNFALTKTDGTTANLQAAKEYSSHKGYFVFNRRIAYALPARRTVSDKHAKDSGRGRRWRILAALNNVSVYGLFNNGTHPFFELQQQASNREIETTRLFFETKKQDKKARRAKTDSNNNPAMPPKEFYTSHPGRFKAGVWDVYAMGEQV